MALISIAVMLFLTTAAHACPNCFASSKAQALQAYYVSIAFMALIPFGMVAGLVLWLRGKIRRGANSSD